MANVTIDTGSPISFGIASSGGTAGNIIINSAITAAYDNGGSAYPQSLTLAADGTVTINAPISNGADSVLSVAITSDRSGYGGGGIAFNDSIHIGGSFSAFTDSGNISMSGTNIIQASSVMLDANGDIGSSANLIRTDTPDLTVGSRSSVDNAFVRETQAVNSANFNVQDTGLLVIDNGMTYGGSISMTSASGTSFVASSGDLTLNSSYGGTIHFNGDGVVDVNGDLSLLGNNYINSSSGDLRVSAANLTLDNGDWIGAYGGNLTVAVDHNITMTNGAYFAAYAGVNVSAGGQLSMTNSSIAAYGGDLNVSANSFTMDSSNIASYGGDINISANTINMSNYSSMDAYGGNLSIGNTSALGAASLTMNNSQLYGGDVLILAQHVNLANSSYVSGFDIGINFFPGDVAALTATSASATAAVAFFTNADVNISSNSSISADHSLGIRTGDLNVDASTGFANLDASSGSMALIAAGSINVKGGNGGYGSDIFASQELFLKAGKQLNVETSSDGTGYARVDVSSSSTLFMSFPLIPKNGWNVDGVDNAFSSKINPSTGIFVAGLPGVLKTNTFVTYGGVTNDSSVKANLSLQAAQLLQTTGQGSTVLSDDDRADQIFGSGEDDKDSGSGKNSKGKKETPKQCGSS
jgi:hypothetical protein